MTNKYEQLKYKSGFKYVIGCDEVGRGCLAGPVVAAAVVLPSNFKLKGIKDSKLLSPAQREALSPQIKKSALSWSISEVSSKVIDEINIHNASLLAMKKAVESLLFSVIPSGARNLGRRPKIASLDPSVSPQDDDKRAFIVVDGKFKIPDVRLDQEAIVDGDNKIISIASASIIAKVYRDNLMLKLHKTYPIYNLAKHKGYATEYHRKIIIKRGLSPIHRLSFCEHLAI